MKKNIFISVLLILFASVLFAQTESQLELAPAKVKEINSEKAVVEFKTNVSNVEVYLNTTFYGRTNLEIKDLLPGIYSVELKLKGYETQQFLINAKKGVSQIYNLEMKLIQGSVTLFNIPEGAEVSFDEKVIFYKYKKGDSNVIYNVPGEHKLGIKCFGFEDFEQNVVIEAYEDFQVQIELTSADLQLSDFRVEKPVFNPDYNGRLGSCFFKYKVTRNAFVIAEAFDSENKLVWTDTFRDLTTWNQGFYWNGKTSEGEKLPDGDYVVKLNAGNCQEEVTVTINRDVNYPLFTANATGSGVGPLPSVFANQFDYFSVYLNVNPTSVTSLNLPAENQKSEFYGLGLNIGAIWDFASHFEVSGQLYTMPGFREGFLGRISGSFKAYNSYKIKDDLILSYGGLLRVGFATKALYNPYLVDNGSGLIGAGGLLGLGGNKWDAGYSSQFIYCPKQGHYSEYDWVWKNSFTGTYKPFKSLGLNGWLGLNSSVSGVGINYGCGLSWIPFSSAIILDLNVDGNVIPGESNYLSVQFGLSYLF